MRFRNGNSRVGIGFRRLCAFDVRVGRTDEMQFWGRV